MNRLDRMTDNALVSLKTAQSREDTVDTYEKRKADAFAKLPDAFQVIGEAICYENGSSTEREINIMWDVYDALKKLMGVEDE